MRRFVRLFVQDSSKDSERVAVCRDVGGKQGCVRAYGRLTGRDADSKVGGIQAGLNGLVKCEAHGGLDVGVLGVQLGVLLQCLACQRAVLVRDVREVAHRIDRRSGGGAAADAQVSLDVLDTLYAMMRMTRDSSRTSIKRIQTQKKFVSHVTVPFEYQSTSPWCQHQHWWT